MARAYHYVARHVHITSHCRPRIYDRHIYAKPDFMSKAAYQCPRERTLRYDSAHEYLARV